MYVHVGEQMSAVKNTFHVAVNLMKGFNFVILSRSHLVLFILGYYLTAFMVLTLHHFFP